MKPCGVNSLCFAVAPSLIWEDKAEWVEGVAGGYLPLWAGQALPPGGNGKSLDEGHFLALQEDKLL